MRISALLAMGVLAVCAALLVRSRLPRESEVRPFSVPSAENTPVCPWREPMSDLAVLFPSATNFTIETKILSQHMADLHKRLGRLMTVDENPLRIHRVLGGERGAVLVKRVKGEHGGIEIVIGVDERARVKGVLIQSQREPAAIAQMITNATFLAEFKGRDASSPLRFGGDLPMPPRDALVSADAIADAVRSGLLLLSFAEKSGAPETTHVHKP